MGTANLGGTARWRHWQTVLARYLSRDSSVGFWYTPLAAHDDYDPAVWRGYYIDFTAKTNYPGPFDAAGIPLLDYKGDLGVRYNPCATAQYALGWWERYGRTNDAVSRDHFLAGADWFVQNLRTNAAGVPGWLYDFSDGAYHIPSIPWISALAQAQGISVLLRAFKFSGKEEYAQTAARAFECFKVPVEAGGVRACDAQGEVFFEEAPTVPRSFILDGYMFSLFGVNDYALALADREARAMFDAGVRTLEHYLPQFDLGFWSRADLYREHPKMIASAFYHNLHVLQLRVLARMTGSRILQHYAERWAANQANPFFRAAAFAYKAWFKLFYY